MCQSPGTRGVKPAHPPAEVPVGDQLLSLAQQLRAHTDAATLAFMAIKTGGVGLHGATSASWW